MFSSFPALRQKSLDIFFLSSTTLQIALIIFNLKRRILPTHGFRKFHDRDSEVTLEDPLAQHNYPSFPWRSLVYFCSVDYDLIFYCPDFCSINSAHIKIQQWRSLYNLIQKESNRSDISLGMHHKLLLFSLTFGFIFEVPPWQGDEPIALLFYFMGTKGAFALSPLTWVSGTCTKRVTRCELYFQILTVLWPWIP